MSSFNQMKQEVLSSKLFQDMNERQREILIKRIEQLEFLELTETEVCRNYILTNISASAVSKDMTHKDIIESQQARVIVEAMVAMQNDVIGGLMESFAIVFEAIQQRDEAELERGTEGLQEVLARSSLLTSVLFQIFDITARARPTGFHIPDSL